MSNSRPKYRKLAWSKIWSPWGHSSMTGARVGAIGRLRMEDLRDHGNHRALQFSERGEKSREIRVRHDLDEWIVTYLEGS